MALFRRKSIEAETLKKDESVNKRVEFGRQLEDQLAQRALAIQAELEKLKAGTGNA